MALHGRFPYGKRAVLSDGGRSGRPKKEVIAPRAFAYRVERPEEDIHLLAGHSFDKPLASRGAGTLDIAGNDDALTFTATITDEMQEVSYVRDILAGIAAGLTLGISPGFRLPPKRAVPEPEKVEDEGHDPENGAHNAIIRTILAALLYELSVVTRPAYPEAQYRGAFLGNNRGRRCRSPQNDGGSKMALTTKQTENVSAYPATPAGLSDDEAALDAAMI